jgi:hypothetical protein
MKTKDKALSWQASEKGHFGALGKKLQLGK